ncbi:MAG: chondroitinase-B domain-containing protein [Lysobacterales bacterium]
MTTRTRRWLCTALFTSSLGCTAGVVPVSTVAELRAAIQTAAPGDEIVLAAGTYNADSNITASTPGTSAMPIIVRAAQPRSVLIRFGAFGGLIEGFRIDTAWWRFEDLDIEGACALDDNCEHAFHLFANAESVVIRGNVVRNFNAQIKSNGDFVAGSFVFPDDVLIERNTLYDTRARNTSNPVTKLDVVGGRRWVVRANTMYDYEKAGGDTISYAAFLKGNSRDGVFERNLVRCSRFTGGGVRLGLSFGGGGTAAQFCEDGTCATEHQNGIMRNNIVMNCSDVGIYINRGANTRLQHNTLYATAGVDVRFATSTADLRNNLLGGAIRNRDGGTSTSSGNVAGVTPAQFAMWFAAPADSDFRLIDGSAFVNQGVVAPLVTDDFCGTARSDGAPDIGALEYSPTLACATQVGGGAPTLIFANSFE